MTVQKGRTSNIGRTGEAGRRVRRVAERLTARGLPARVACRAAGRDAAAAWGWSR
ncbi:MAG TPA: hypothetical protein VL242_25160 [Sorangium sp.]|uniref:hypothetical protein n=1 Tax=unclassified Sorangium TaxID=2621164 RepID=UPI002BF08C91|nr:hypothetical protein [Sorangium sp.]